MAKKFEDLNTQLNVMLPVKLKRELKKEARDRGMLLQGYIHQILLDRKAARGAGDLVALDGL